MKVVKPVIIEAAELVSSTVPENDYAAWSGATDYAVGSRAVFGRVVYESVQTPNLNHAPATSPLYWARIGPTNRWAMFDAEIATQTAAESEIAVVVKPGFVNSLALFGLEGSGISVTVTDGPAGPQVYSHQQSLDGSLVEDWYSYFFEPIDQLEELVLTGLPPYSTGHISVSITGVGTVKCGILAAGNVYYLGQTQRGASAGIIDYSRKDTNANGTTTFVKRRFSKRMSAALVVDNFALNKLQRVLASLRATPCVWIGTDAPGYQPLTVFGFYRDFSIDVAYSRYSYCNLEIEGLT
jgi:hypothetical protein